MFELNVKLNDGTKEVWDGLTAMQAECLLFRAKSNANTASVVMYEFTV
jgi:hypothetical protein